MPDRVIDDGVKIQALTLISTGIKVPQVKSLVNISESQLYRLKKKAIERGWGGLQTSPILLSYVLDAPRSGRPTVCTPKVLTGINDYVENNDDSAVHQSCEELA